MTILEIRLAYDAKEDHDLSMFCLAKQTTYDLRILHDDLTISDYGISHEDTLEIMSLTSEKSRQTVSFIFRSMFGQSV